MISIFSAVLLCIGTLVLTLAASAALLLHMRRKTSARLVAVLEGATQNAQQFAEDAAHEQKELGELFEQSTRDLRAQLETAAAIRAELEHQNRSLDTKYQNQQQVIATLVKERDFWHKWHLDETAAHSAAQHYMFNEIELHVKRGCKIPFGPQLAVIVQEFDEKFPGQAPAPDPGAPSGSTPENRV